MLKRTGVVLLTTLFASAGVCAEAPATASPTPGTNAAWFSRAWQSEDRLSDNTVVGIAQPPDGLLWVATASGLVRFDGLHFQEPAPSGNFTPAFLGDRRGRLWLGKMTIESPTDMIN